MNDVKEHLKKGFERFSIGTSIHGFAELYTAKTPFWAICWILILLGSFGVTVYQVHSAVALYIAEPTSTTLLPAKDKNVIYPPLQVCFMIWLFWVDWETVLLLKIEKSALLYGLNYFNAIYSSDHINMTHAENSFQRLMVDNKFPTIFDFFKTISKKPPAIFKDEMAPHFDETVILFKDPGYLFCYKMSNMQMKLYLSSLISAKSITIDLPDWSYESVSDHVSKQEYTKYMMRWVQLKSMYRVPTNFTGNELLDFVPPIVLFPNGYDTQTVDIYAENDVYNINFDATVRTLKNSDRNVCLEGKETYFGDNTCQFECEARFSKALCSCYALDMAIALKETNSTNICHKSFFNNIADNNETKSVDFGNLTLGSEKCLDEEIEIENLNTEFEQCVEKCINPCTTWTYDFTTSVTKMAAAVRKIGIKSNTRVNIQYPLGNDIIVMTEVDSQTFDSFVANVGGLLGIWTGASMTEVDLTDLQVTVITATT